MNGLSAGRAIIGVLVALGMLAGCGGSGTTAFVPSAMVRSAARPAGKSSGELLYAVMERSGTHIFTYPHGKPLANLGAHGFSASNPNNGEVLIGGIEGGVALYTHDGKLLQIIDPTTGYGFSDSTFDPTSSAIAMSVLNQPEGSVAVYPSPSGSPVTYSMPNIGDPRFVGYDSAGDLFVDGIPQEGVCCALAELPKGATQFVALNLSKPFRQMGSIQWDGSYITVASGNAIYRFAITGSEATVVGVTKMQSARTLWDEFSIQGDTVLGAIGEGVHQGGIIGFWHYPKGGRAYKSIAVGVNHKDRAVGATVSIAPT